MSKTITHTRHSAVFLVKGCTFLVLILFANTLLFSQPLKSLQVELEKAKSSQEKIASFVHLSSQCTDRKDYLLAVEYLAVVTKLDEADNNLRPNKHRPQFNQLAEKVFKPLSEESLKKATQSLEEQDGGAGSYNFAAWYVADTYNSDYAVELAEKELSLGKASNKVIQQGIAYYTTRAVRYSQDWVKQAENHFLQALESFQIGIDTMRAALLDGKITYAATEDFFELRLKTPL